MFKKILVAVDGSEHSDRAIDAACDIAGKYSDAVIIFAHAPMVGLTGLGLGAGSVGVLLDDQTLLAAGQTVLNSAELRARATDCVSTSTKILKGDPAEAIVSEATACGADLIVAGRRGLGKLKGMLLGSVSQKLIAHAPCAVLTIN